MIIFLIPLSSRGNFSSLRLVSWPQFLLIQSDETALEFEADQSMDEESEDGRYLCALLKLELSEGGWNATSWDLGSCSLMTRNTWSFYCNCTTSGTIVLLYAQGFPQVSHLAIQLSNYY